MTELQPPHAWGTESSFDTIPLTKAPLSSHSPRLLEKRQSLVEKLFPSPQPEAPRDVIPVLVQEKGREGGLTNTQQPALKPATTGLVSTQQLQEAAVAGVVEAGSEPLNSPSVAPAASSSASTALAVPATGERLFVFRVPPEPQGTVASPRRKRKRNFLNLKKGSVAPTKIPWDLQSFPFDRILLYLE